jgi:hypothetical protein
VGPDGKAGGGIEPPDAEVHARPLTAKRSKR